MDEDGMRGFLLLPFLAVVRAADDCPHPGAPQNGRLLRKVTFSPLTPASNSELKQTADNNRDDLCALLITLCTLLITLCALWLWIDKVGFI